MTSLPPSPQGTPSRAASQTPSPLPRNPMEDADSSVTRKRPRLDRGEERARQSMSAEPSLPAVASSSVAQAEQPSTETAVDRGTTTPFTPTTPTSPRQLDGTPSKVTINVRTSDKVRSSSTRVDEQRSHVMSQGDASPILAQMKLSDDPFSPSEAIVVGSPSYPGSPPMEVADPEDFDGHNGPSVWHTTGSIQLDGLQRFESALAEFPYRDADTDVASGLEQLAHRLQNMEIKEPVLSDLAEWLDSCVDATTDCSTEEWDKITGEYRDILELLPQMLEHLSERKLRERSDYDFLYSDGVHRATVESPGPLHVFLRPFAILTARLLNRDVASIELVQQTSVADTRSPPALLGPIYLRALRCVALPGQIFFNIQERFGWPIQKVAGPAAKACIDNLDHGTNTLTQFFLAFMEMSPLDTDFLLNISETLRLYTFFSRHSGPEDQSAKDMVSFFTQVDAKLQEMITKQSTTLNIDSLKPLFESLSTILHSLCMRHAQHLDYGGLVPESYASDFEAMDSQDKPHFVTGYWQMRFLKKCIMKGRMDARALGAEEMSEHLVHVYNRYLKSPENCRHPVPRLHADFIQENKLLEYLVGVHSHTQLVPRSKNTIGFLVVANRYSEKETDIIWTSFLESQDPRRAEAILVLAAGVLDLITDVDHLIYWNRKLHELPTKRFEPQYVQNFSSRLSWSLLRRNPDRATFLLVEPPRHALYIRLAKEVYVVPDLSTEKKREIVQFAATELTNIAHSIDPSEVIPIHEECLRSIAAASPHSTGSYMVMNFLMDHVGLEKAAQDLSVLEQNLSLTREIITDCSRMQQVERDCQTTTLYCTDILLYRLFVVRRIVHSHPEYFTKELTKSLWSNLVGNESPGGAASDIAWQFISQTIEQFKGRRNSFIDRILKEHFPTLDAHLYTSSVFQFAKAGTEYELALAQDTENNDGGSVGELFWPIVINAQHSVLATKAINSLVEVQLSYHDSSEEAMNAHARFVARAIQHLIGASEELKELGNDTSGGEDEMVIIAPQSQLSTARQKFLRSLEILQKFVERTRSHRSFSPDLSVKSPTGSDGTDGKEILIRYQPYVGGKASGTHTLRMGDLATFEDLLARLSDATGFSSFSMFAHGQKIDQEHDRQITLRELRHFQREGVIMIQKQPGIKINKAYKKTRGFNRVELEVMNHFHVLYELLGLDNQLSDGVYRFLTIFPPHDEIAALVYDQSQETATIFPLDTVYKAIYSVHALQSVIDQNLSEGAAPPELLRQAVKVLVAAIMALEVKEDLPRTRTDLFLAKSYVECLLKILRERVSSEVYQTYIDDPASFIVQLRSTLDIASANLRTENAGSVVDFGFALMLEASAQNDRAWATFKDQCLTKDLLRLLLLDSPSVEVRHSTKASLLSFLAALPSFYNVSHEAVEEVLWSAVAALVPAACSEAQHPEHFFTCTLDIYMMLSESTRTKLPLTSYVVEWSRLLSQHQHHEWFGVPSVDYVAYGLSGLLEWTIKLMMSEKRPLSLELPENLATDIVDHHLFPKYLIDPNTQQVNGSMPILDSRTRSHLYSILLATASDVPTFAKLVAGLKDVIPETPLHSIAYGYAQPHETQLFNFYSAWDIDRSQIIRADSGYAGLRNLQNTCYMNSLLTQLFMNIGFRDFLLQLQISDSVDSQRLLFETQKVLAYMQDTWIKAVDSENLADAIVTYEGTPIDVTIQMDVDEFYNLLFDRWESQISDAEEKKKFRGFYGGELVQQIKSRDCPHVSERIESFSAIQCDIQGKQNLAESLSAYVGGEMMEGDNKYSCSTCGSYVNAVKRACFKTLPDNLILHLKRFDYDLMTGIRSKINDRFEFPETIDMAPYHIDHLQDSTTASEPDNFTLVGILVHTGSAEAGHYYSYIRERPNKTGAWLEFNDADVCYFDPKNTDNLSFGGWTDSWNGQMAFQKQYNAYMLFYERTTALQAENSAVALSSTPGPIKVSIPPSIKSNIEIENRQFFQLYSLFDLEHVRFLRCLVERYLDLTKDGCSDAHNLESFLVGFTLDHLHAVFARQKDCKELVPMLDLVAKLSIRCPRCSSAFHSWLADHFEETRALMLRCPRDTVRKRSFMTLYNSLVTLRETDPGLYGLDVDSPTSEVEIRENNESTSSLGSILGLLRSILPYMPSHSRSWEDFYGLLIDIASLGIHECTAMAQSDFLTYCIELVALSRHRHYGKNSTFEHHASYIRGLERRRYNYANVVGLIDLLLSKARFPRQFLRELPMELWPKHSTSYVLKERDAVLLLLTEDRQDRSILTVVDEMVMLAGDNVDSCRRIFRTLTATYQDGEYNRALVHTALKGRRTSFQGLRPYLFAALGYCDINVAELDVERMFQGSLKKILSYENPGPEFVDFLRLFREIQNPHISYDNPGFFQRLFLDALPEYVPRLLFSDEPKTRRAMFSHLPTLCKVESSEGRDAVSDSEPHVLHNVVLACVEFAESLAAEHDGVRESRLVEIQGVLQGYQTDLTRQRLTQESQDGSDQLEDRIHTTLGALDTLAMTSPEEVGSNMDFESDEFTDATDNVQ